MGCALDSWKLPSWQLCKFLLALSQHARASKDLTGCHAAHALCDACFSGCSCFVQATMKVQEEQAISLEDLALSFSENRHNLRLLWRRKFCAELVTASPTYLLTKYIARSVHTLLHPPRQIPTAFMHFMKYTRHIPAHSICLLASSLRD